MDDWSYERGFFHSYGLATHHKKTDEQNKSIVTRWNYDTYTFSVVLSGGAARVLKAEREGFEPPEARTSTVFKTAAIDHSATSPVCLPYPLQSWRKGTKYYLPYK